MIPAFVLKIVLFALALVFLFLLVRSLFVRPDRRRAGSGRIRLPRYVGIGAAALLVFGLIAGMLGFGSGDMRDPVPFRITSVALVVVGLLVLWGYRNWYLAPGPDAIAFRTVFGVERVIRYGDIASHRMLGRHRRRTLVVTSTTGTRLRVNTSAHDVTPLLAAVGDARGVTR